MVKGKKSTMSKESKVDGKGAGASKNNNKVSPEDDKNDAPLNSTTSPTTDPAEAKWDIVRVLEDPNACDCRTGKCERKAVAVWASNLDPTDEWPMCKVCQEKDFTDEDEQESESKETDDKESEEVATEEQAEQAEQIEETAEDTPTADEPCNDKQCDPSDPSEVVSESNDGKVINAKDGENEEEDEHEEVEEAWDVKKIMSIADVNDGPIKCKTETCALAAACVYVSNMEPTTKWYSCLDCQEQDFGGWPEPHELPIDSMTQEHKDALISKCSRKKDTRMPNFAASPSKEDEDEEMEEVWDVKKIMSIADVNDGPIKCKTETCALAAACVYVSNMEPTTKWYSCLDCQETDFGGWPEPHELPIDSMTQEHKDALISKCSRKKDTRMPNFAASPSKECENKPVSHTVTPLPNHNHTATQAAGNKNGNPTVTPCPAVGLAAAKAPAPITKPNKQSLEFHRKWQAAAEAMGGPDARIVVSKPVAKKIIFDFLNDAFRPMNITEIHKALKAVVPSPVLKSCLDDMALDKAEEAFVESDDEDEPPKKPEKPKQDSKPSDDPYKGALSFKSGRSANSCLYYVDYTKLKNNGDGLPPNERNELSGNLHKTNAELEALKTTIKNTTLETDKLLSEPTNEEATARLETEESTLAELQDQVEAGRKLKVNEKHKQQTKRRIDAMTTYWRKRRRICMEFLIAMEENTDGTVSVKKCLKGDGQIDIDSDEAIVAAAIEYSKKKLARPALGKKKRTPVAAKTTPKSSTASSLPASESFVAVTLDSQGRVQRVHLDDNE